jgi:hypothetical protein
VRVLRSRRAPCVGRYGACLGEWACVVCGTVWSVSGGVSVCCVWDSLVRVWGRECVLFVGQFGACLGE